MTEQLIKLGRLTRQIHESLGVFRNTEWDEREPLEQEDADYLLLFLGRRCRTCAHFVQDGKSCQVNRTGIQVSDFPVSSHGYCDLYQPSDLAKKSFEQAGVEFQPSREYTNLLEKLEESGAQSAETLGYYPSILGVCCDTCRYIRGSGVECRAVKGSIERSGCCDSWAAKDGYPIDPQKNRR